MQNDTRWSVLGEKLVPPPGNANYAWIMHFIYHLAPTGQAGFVLSKGSLTSQTSTEGDIRKALIEKGLIDCIVNLPTKLFLNTQIPACLWFISRDRNNSSPFGRGWVRADEILFIDARNLGFLVNRRNRDLSEEDINKIANTYHNWRSKESNYEDIAGFCKSETLDRIKELNYVLTPGRYVGLPDDEDDFNFVERFTSLKAELEKQLAEENQLNKAILENLSKIKLG